ncbi:hypothetical protein PSCICO_37950 [Pseudomonas cichorii]|uniref:hypothetical protein n=1 Tax=Pseudomonas cichorii TaxID=36746 RepID=UPI00191053DB|nr:hypothetical protein [Pseudomonas cichorii]GFM88396.1 hypothetical protein PSCICO_37950 [Pseudomonas cichorii]
MNIKEIYKKEYIEAFSHIELAEKIGVSLSLLDSHAELQGWKEEHRLYWFDKSVEQLKVELINGNVVAVKEMLKLAGMARPVGRPKKADVEKYLNIKAKIDNEFDADVKRMALVKP